MNRRTDLRFTPEVYGVSAHGAPLHWVPALESCDTLIVAGLHGEEPETTVILSRALRCLPEQPRHTACVLAANPDGLALGTRGNARGVDLNRNFPAANWQPHPVGVRWHVDEPEIDPVPIRTGDAPASEPETAALIALIERLAPRRVIGLHAPLACIDDPGRTTAGRWLAERAGLPLVEDIGYPVPGSMGTWAGELGLPLITWEFPAKSVEALSRETVPVLLEWMLTWEEVS